MASFDALLAEAEARPTEGWDFGWLGARMRTDALPWDYTAIVTRRAAVANNMLDLGTGGGEWLAALPIRPALTVATEAWQPNVPVAARTLAPLGVGVVAVDAAPDNTAQAIGQTTPRLPFRDQSFDLIASRHESFVATEVARVLAPGGRFITQQLGDGLFGDVRALFGEPPATTDPWTLDRAIAQLDAAGFSTEHCEAGSEVVAFADVGALAWYLRMTPWSVPGFSTAARRAELRRVDARIRSEGPLRLELPGFVVVAVKRG